MSLLARRNLFHYGVRFAVTLTGIVLVLVLIIIQFGSFWDLPQPLRQHRSFECRFVDRGRNSSERKLYQVELDSSQRLPLDLRVDSFVETSKSQKKIGHCGQGAEET